MGLHRRCHVLPLALAACLSFPCTLASARLIRVPLDQPTIQAAIDDADHGDTVLISPGTWTGPGNFDLDTGGKAIVIRSLGGPDSCIIDCQGLGRGLYFHSCESAATVVLGLTIRGGRAQFGGGIAGYWCSPKIVDCTITGCRAAGEGGAVSGRYFSLQLIDCRLEGNQAMDGGGICLDYSPAARLIRCTIRDNTAQRCGGGVCSSVYSTPLLLDCTISDNSALLGGGVSCRDSAATIQGCRIEENKAWDGGGLFTCGACGPQLLDSLLVRNKATYGGAAYGTHGTLHLDNCLLAENSAAITGGALYGRQLAGTMDGCTLNCNSAGETRGGAVTSRASQLVITDSILWGNRPDEIHSTAGEHPLVTFSNVAGGFPGLGNLDRNPLFTCAPCGSHCLSQLAAGEAEQSPCTDVGSRPARCPSSPAHSGTTGTRGTITRSDWGADTGRLDLGYHHQLKTVSARLDCLPSFGWLPFQASFTVTLGNTGPSARRIAARVDVSTADGACYPAWRAGWSDVDPGKEAAWSWYLDLPASPAQAGTSTFSLTAEDVTPAPFNQPPSPPAGHRAGDVCTVTGVLAQAQ